jgi:hypothetical protein
LNTSISSNNNIGIGTQSLYTSSSGTNNIGIGTQSLYSISNSFNNIAIGDSSLFNISYSGSHNICLGYFSGSTITSGSSNIQIGSSSGGTGFFNLQSASNNIYIGSNIRNSFNANNEIIIGNGSIITQPQGYGNNTAYIVSSSGIFGGKYPPINMGLGIFTPLSNMNGSYINLMNGLVFQYYSFGSGVLGPFMITSVNWSLPVPFSSQIIFANAILQNSTGLFCANLSFSIQSITTSSVIFSICNTSANNQDWQGFRVFAIGY